MVENSISKKDLFKYSFFDENSKLVYVLDVDYLKKLLNADIIMLEETEHK